MSLLRFSMLLPNVPESVLKVGNLIYKNNGLTETFAATTGSVGNQYRGCQNKIRKGCLPSHISVGIKNYEVSTQRLWLPQVKGIEGSFFPIQPFSVDIRGTIRGDFGIHFDANVPGSAGCIVLRTQAGWTRFLEIMASLNTRRIKSVPLHVNYE